MIPSAYSSENHEPAIHDNDNGYAVVVIRTLFVFFAVVFIILVVFFLLKKGGRRGLPVVCYGGLPP